MSRSNKQWMFVVALCWICGSGSAFAENTRWQMAMNHGNRLRQLGDYVEAMKAFQTALAEAEKFEPEDSCLIRSLSGLAALYTDLGRYTEAAPLCERALAISEKALGAEHPMLAVALNNLAQLYHVQRRYAEAESQYERALSIREKVLGQYHPDVAVVTNSLAQLYLKDHRYAEAEPLFQQAWSIWEKSLGANRPDLATSLQGYALVLRKTKPKPEAEAMIRRAKDILARNPVVNPANHIDVRALAFDNKRGWEP